MGRKFKWTDDEMARLNVLWNVELKSASQIADLMGYTRNAIIGQCHRQGFPARPGCVDEQNRQYATTRAKGRSPEELHAMRLVRKARENANRNLRRAKARAAGIERRTNKATIPKAFVFAPRPPPEPAPPMDHLRLTIMQLGLRSCRKPLWTDTSTRVPVDERLYCGRPTPEGQPYCVQCVMGPPALVSEWRPRQRPRCDKLALRQDGALS